jgi:sulfoxide reductase heme-binding subunit YedZ
LSAVWLRWGVKPLLFAACLSPALLLVWRAWGERLGPNPVEALSHASGDWALRLLLPTLAVTPLRRASGWAILSRLRRMLGLFAVFYALLHFSVWLLLDQGLIWELILDDLTKRPYIILGASALLLLLPLALTSTRGWMRRLGPSWERLHRLVYPAALLAVAHYLWLVKADYREPLVYAGALAVLLAMRAVGFSNTRSL